MTSRERCLAVLHGGPVDRTPVFPLVMHAAQVRHGVTYRRFATHAPTLVEAQLRFRERFPVDVLTVCSDACRTVADQGAAMAYPDAGPPHTTAPLVRSAADVDRLHRLDPLRPGSRMADRIAAVEGFVRHAGDALVCGWIEMPFADACELCGVSGFLLLLQDDPALAHRILDFCTGVAEDFALAQISAGAPLIGAGDAAASLLSPAMYQAFALPYEQRVCAAIHRAGALAKLHICGNTRRLIPHLVRSGADLINIDHMVDLATAHAAYSAAGIACKGNLDPVADILQATPEHCRTRCRACLDLTGGRRWLLGAGCEIPAATPDAVLDALCSNTGPSSASGGSPSSAGFPASPEGTLSTIGGQSPPDGARPGHPSATPCNRSALDPPMAGGWPDPV